MRFAFYTTIISPHQLPLAREISRLVGERQFKYVYQSVEADRGKLGWKMSAAETWITDRDEECETAQYLHSAIRLSNLYERRSAQGLVTLYSSERWFKPPRGILRLLSPGYLRMAWRFVRLIKKDEKFFYFPYGIHAAEDMARLCGLFSGDLRCLFWAPKLAFERVPGGEIHLTTEHTELNQAHEIHEEECAGFSVSPRDSATAENTGAHSGEEKNDIFSGGSEAEPNGVSGKMPTSHGFHGQGSFSQQEVRYGLDKMGLWGYFVEPSSWSAERLKVLRTKQREEVTSGKRPLRILWVGRMLDWKRVDTLVKAVKLLNAKAVRATLTLVGYGPEEAKLHALALGHNEIAFHQQVPIDQIRNLMREHDLYVLPSNGFEGWGAVVSEALAEQMPVLGSFDAGATATLLSSAQLFRAGDVAMLARKITWFLNNDLEESAAETWMPKNAACVMVHFASNR